MLEYVLVLKRINTVLRCIFVIGSFISLVLLLLAKYRPRNQINSNQPDFGVAPQVNMVSTLSW